MDSIKNITADELNQYPGSMPSLLVGQVLPGDLVHLPFGYIFLEKCVNARSVTLKVAWQAQRKPCLYVLNICSAQVLFLNGVKRSLKYNSFLGGLKRPLNIFCC